MASETNQNSNEILFDKCDQYFDSVKEKYGVLLSIAVMDKLIEVISIKRSDLLEKGLIEEINKMKKQD